jgi:transposase
MKGERLFVDKVADLQEYLRAETDPKLRLKLAFLHCVAQLAPDLERLCASFGIATSTGYWWIRNWNREGYTGLQEEGTRSGRPPRLDDVDISYLRLLLKEQTCWTLPEIADLIKRTFGIAYSPAQLVRILRQRVKLHFSKPFPHDYRRPPDAEDRLKQALRETFQSLQAQGLKPGEIAIGCVDETSPQNRANTARVWSLEPHPTMTKNTTHFKSNTIGFYALQGVSVQTFLENSKEDSIIAFLHEIRTANAAYPAIIVVLDNYVSHKSAKVRAAAKALGIHLVHLPPYSPDLNPTEYIWKSLRRVLSKRFIKNLEEMKATIATTWNDLSGSLSFAHAWITKFLAGELIYSELCV